MYGEVEGAELEAGLDAAQHDVVGDLTRVPTRQDIVLRKITS